MENLYMKPQRFLIQFGRQFWNSMFRAACCDFCLLTQLDGVNGRYE